MPTLFTPDEYREARVTLERGPCFGICPSYTLAISGDGWVVYKGDWCVEVAGRCEEHIGVEKAVALARLLVIQGFLSLADRYDYDEHITDQATTSLTLEVGGVAKRVIRYGHPPGTPRRLLFLEDQVDQVGGARRWVGALMR